MSKDRKDPDAEARLPWKRVKPGDAVFIATGQPDPLNII